jgi:hypothetical protein
MRHPHGLRAAANNGFDMNTPIGAFTEGGYFAGFISHTADSNPTHALIVAPAATGATGTGYPVTTDLQFRTAQVNGSTSSSSFDGSLNTSQLVGLGISTYPAAKFCVERDINGFTDWYLPARYELDIAYQNLKPTTTSNSTLSGINPYAVPERTANRTAGNPSQTSVAIFQSGQPQQFIDSLHWTSLWQPSTPNAWLVRFNTGFNGYNVGDANGVITLTRGVRAFRRVEL